MKRLLIVLVVLALLAAGCFAGYRYLSDSGQTSQLLVIRFLDVGQADSAIIQCGGASMLIDAGNTDDSQFIYSYLRNTLSLTHLDVVVATHAHEDHIGGIAAALNACTAGIIYCPVTESNTACFSNLLKYAGKQGLSLTIPAPGETFSLGAATVTFLAPINTYEEENNSSLVLRIDYGETSFLFTGDAEYASEQDMISSDRHLKADVLKVGHHGSASSSSYEFIQAVKPRYAVISVGAGNTYGHPTEEVLSRLNDVSADIYRTDESGTILCRSDGNTITFTTEKGSMSTRYTDGTVPVKDASYIGNRKTKRFHNTDCSGVRDMAEKNKVGFSSRDDAVNMGYEPCGMCQP